MMLTRFTTIIPSLLLLFLFSVVIPVSATPQTNTTAAEQTEKQKDIDKKADIEKAVLTLLNVTADQPLDALSAVFKQTDLPTGLAGLCIHYNDTRGSHMLNKTLHAGSHQLKREYYLLDMACWHPEKISWGPLAGEFSSREASTQFIVGRKSVVLAVIIVLSFLTVVFAGALVILMVLRREMKDEDVLKDRGPMSGGLGRRPVSGLDGDGDRMKHRSG